MQLLLQREFDQRSETYRLYVVLLADQNEVAVIEQHQFTALTLYAVPQVQDNFDLATRALQTSDSRSVFSPTDARRHLSDVMRATLHFLLARTGFVVTVAGALSGTTVTCRDLFELLQCERDITDNFNQLYQHVQEAIAFANGREQVLTPEDQEQDTGVPPEAWANQHVWRRADHG
ncbi:MAG: hypothetical protein K0U74_11955 [Alphaproteobacteria bacterium]|nr:hypothetical protein [Alphaproteobacteria bacterium]